MFDNSNIYLNFVFVLSLDKFYRCFELLIY